MILYVLEKCKILFVYSVKNLNNSIKIRFYNYNFLIIHILHLYLIEGITSQEATQKGIKNN